MTHYRSKTTLEAVQYTGQPIPDVTCEGDSTDKDRREAARQRNGCDGNRAHLPHVHTQVVGGLSPLILGMWVFPVIGGPFGVASDAKFRASWEVPEPAVDVPTPEPVVEPEPTKLPSLDEILAYAGLPTADQIKASLAELEALKAAQETLKEAHAPYPAFVQNPDKMEGPGPVTVQTDGDAPVA